MGRPEEQMREIEKMFQSEFDYLAEFRIPGWIEGSQQPRFAFDGPCEACKV